MVWNITCRRVLASLDARASDALARRTAPLKFGDTWREGLRGSIKGQNSVWITWGNNVARADSQWLYPSSRYYRLSNDVSFDNWFIRTRWKNALIFRRDACVESEYQGIFSSSSDKTVINMTTSLIIGLLLFIGEFISYVNRPGKSVIFIMS